MINQLPILQNVEYRSISEPLYVPVPRLERFARPVIKCGQGSDERGDDTLPTSENLPDLMPAQPMHPSIVAPTPPAETGYVLPGDAGTSQRQVTLALEGIRSKPRLEPLVVGGFFPASR